MKETTISKIAKVIFVIALIIFLLKEQSLYALNVLRQLIINNILIVSVIIIIILIMKGGKK